MVLGRAIVVVGGLESIELGVLTIFVQFLGFLGHLAFCEIPRRCCIYASSMQESIWEYLMQGINL